MSGDGFFRPRSRTQCCNGTFPPQNCFCGYGWSGRQENTWGERPVWAEPPTPVSCPSTSWRKGFSLCQLFPREGPSADSSFGGVRNEDLLGGDNLASGSPQSEGEPHPPSTSKSRDIPPWSSEAGLRPDSSGKSGSSFQQWGEKLGFPEVPTASEQRSCLGSDSFFSKTWGPGSPGSCLGSRQVRGRMVMNSPASLCSAPLKVMGEEERPDLLPRFLLEM